MLRKMEWIVIKKLNILLAVFILLMSTIPVSLADEGDGNDKEPLRYVFLSGYTTQNNALRDLAEEYEKNGTNIEITVFYTAYMTSDTEEQQKIEDAVNNADIISIQMVGASTFTSFLEDPVKNVIGKDVYIYDDVSRANLYNDHPADYLFTNATLTAPFDSTMLSYWSNSTYETLNLEYMISYVLLGLYGEEKLKEDFGIEGLEYKPVISLADAIIYHPRINEDDVKDCFMTDYDAYIDWYKSEKESESGYEYKYNPENPTVGIAFYKSYYPDKMDPVTKIIEELEKKNINVVAATEPNFINSSTVDIILNFQYMRSPPAFDYEELGLPIINVLTADQTYEEWMNLTNPLTASPTRMIYPERYGSIDPIIVASSEKDENGRAISLHIPEQIDLLIGQTVNYLDLQRTENGDKDIALIYYNHGGGKGNIGASYLDVPASLIEILNGLKYADDPFNIDLSKVPTQDDLTQTMITQGINIGGWAPGELKKMVGDFDVSDGKDYYDTGKAALISEKLYMRWFREAYLGDWFENTLVGLSEEEQKKRIERQQKLYESKLEEVEDMWGTAPGDIMVYEGYIVIPYVDVTEDDSKGRFILTPQPSRGHSENAQTLYHSGTLAPTHQYIAFYLWLQNKETVKTEEYGFGADAIIHLGTHGTQEWLPGKEAGLSRYDWAEFMTGYIPVVYPYIVDVVGEGIQAKRRGSAVLIDHMTPAITFADLYGDYDTLKNSIVSFESLQLNDDVKAEHKKTIISLIMSTGIGRELGVTEEQLTLMGDEEFDNVLESTDEYLEELRLEYMPYGMHIFGKPLEGKSLNEMVMSMVGTEYVRYVMSIEGLAYEDAVGFIDEALRKGQSDSVIDNYLNAKKDTNPEYVIPSINGDQRDKINSYLNTGIRYSALLNMATQEISQMVKALEGKFIFPKPGGDPVTNTPSDSGERGVIPTGGNFYNFDSRKIPTPQAWDTAVPLTHQLLLEYYENHNGEWPRTMGFVLFAGETTRSEGVMEAQILYSLGVKPTWNASGYVSGFYPLKAEDLTITIDRDLYYNETGSNGQVVKSTLLAKKGDVLQRPRMDIVVEISGLYRDTYPDRVRLIDEAVRKTYYWYDHPYTSGGESWTTAEPTNNVYLNVQEIIKSTVYEGPEFDEFGNAVKDDPNQAILSRVFSEPAETYGTGIEELAGANQYWNNTGDLAEHYINRMGYAYTSLGEWGTNNNKELYKKLLSTVDTTVHSRTTALYGVVDIDDFYQYLGGLNAAVSYSREDGQYPDSYIMNLRKGEGSMDPLGKFIEREIQARYANPKWSEGMQEHGYAGAREFAKTIENLWGWSAVQPDLITDDMWNTMYESFLTGDNAEWLKSDPLYSYSHQSVLARMIQTATKEDGKYWNASSEIMDNLVKEYVNSVVQNGVACCHHTCGNPLFDQFIAGQMSVAGVSAEEQKEFLKILEEATERTVDSNVNENPGVGSGSNGGGSVGSARVVSTSEPTNEGSEQSGGYGTEPGSAPVNEVSGYEMTTSEQDGTFAGIRDFLQNPTFSASSAVALIIVILAVGAIFYGFRRKN